MGVTAPYSQLRNRMADISGVVMVIGGADTGKTTVARMLLSDALKAGRTVAYVDADIAGSTVGPAGCVGLSVVESGDDLENLADPDELRFVGAVEPNGVVLPHVVAVAALVDVARARADLVVVDTTNVVSGVVGQTLKYHIAELTKPELIVALSTGSELDPVIGMLRRFLSVRVAEIDPPDGIIPQSPVERQLAGAAAFHKDLGDNPP
ncbi:MAG: Clp1/GlmU family protein, partial [Actinomycetota bacterium]